MKKLPLIAFLSIFSILTLHSQDTFSIVAVDSITGEVGSAGASCVDLTGFPGLTDHFLGELFPGVGAINSQAYYIPANQANARDRMNAGDTPAEIIDWLINNDVQNQPEIRQYGIVAMVDGNPETAAHTGASTDAYKNHITGPNYSIQGNILLGQEILDAMEAGFLNASGDLACKLMAALQGANVVGADTRCTPNGSSSLFAFVKVAQPDDSFGNPSFVVSVRTSNGDQIEPIDSLQTLFQDKKFCSGLGSSEIDNPDAQIAVFPNPFQDKLTVTNDSGRSCKVDIVDVAGKRIVSTSMKDQVEISTVNLESGVYFLNISDGNYSFSRKLIKN